MLREVRTQHQHTLSARDLLARELRENSYAVEKWEDDSWSIQNVRDTAKMDRWHQYAAEWSALRKKHLGLWNEIADSYDALGRTISHGAQPPASAALSDLAQRLETAEF